MEKFPALHEPRARSAWKSVPLTINVTSVTQTDERDASEASIPRVYINELNSHRRYICTTILKLTHLPVEVLNVVNFLKEM